MENNIPKHLDKIYLYIEIKLKHSIPKYENVLIQSFRVKILLIEKKSEVYCVVNISNKKLESYVSLLNANNITGW